MVSHGLDTGQARKVWQPFLDWVARAPQTYDFAGPPEIGSMPARRWWDVEWRKEHHHQVFVLDSRGEGPSNVWWTGDAGQVGWFIWGFESLWLPASLLDDGSQERLTNALFASSRHSGVEPHFNKGLAGAPPDAVAGAGNTAINPVMRTAFELAITADGGPHIRKFPAISPKWRLAEKPRFAFIIA